MPASASTVRRAAPAGGPATTAPSRPAPAPSPGPGGEPEPVGPSAAAPAAPAVEGTPLPGGIPTPPQPPFTAREDGGWEVALPSALGRTVTIGVDAAALTLAGERVPYDQIDQVRFRVDVGDALLRRAASARMTVEVTRRDGGSVRVAARNAASARRAEAIVATLGYLWDLLGGTAGVRQRDDLLDRIERGGEVQVGGLRLTDIGIAWKREPIVPWSDVGVAEVADLAVVIPVGGRSISVSVAEDDAYMLPSLIAAVRRRHGAAARADQRRSDAVRAEVPTATA